MKYPEDQEQRDNSGLVMGGLVSAVIGTVVAFFSSGIVIPLIYGIQSRDSASVWGLSGAAEWVVGFLSLPAFLIAHSVAFAVSRSEGSTTSWRAARSLMIGLGVFWVVITIAWHYQGGGMVLRSQ